MCTRVDDACVLRLARRRFGPDATTCPYPGWSGDRQVVGNVGLH